VLLLPATEEDAPSLDMGSGGRAGEAAEGPAWSGRGEGMAAAVLWAPESDRSKSIGIPMKVAGSMSRDLFRLPRRGRGAETGGVSEGVMRATEGAGERVISGVWEGEARAAEGAGVSAGGRGRAIPPGRGLQYPPRAEPRPG
jgi:hypothetical protein